MMLGLKAIDGSWLSYIHPTEAMQPWKGGIDLYVPTWKEVRGKVDLSQPMSESADTYLSDHPSIHPPVYLPTYTSLCLMLFSHSLYLTL